MKYTWGDSASVNIASTQTTKIFIGGDLASVQTATMTIQFNHKLLRLRTTQSSEKMTNRFIWLEKTKSRKRA